MKEQILAPQQEQWREAVRQRLVELDQILTRLRAPASDHSTLADLLTQLDELFLLVVVGEFNSGKSALINTLVGRKVVEEGVVPTTSRIQVLKFGDRAEESQDTASKATIAAPVPLLEDIHIVDTPGTNAIDRHHEELTEQFLPRADLVLFVTSADRPFTESERVFLEKIRNWGKKIVLVINKIDILASAEDLARVEDYVRTNSKALIGVVPEVFPVSARQASSARSGGDEGKLAASRFPALEDYIVRVLDQAERVRLKLLNPIGAGRHVIERHLATLDEQAEVLQQDLSTIEEIESHLTVYRQDMDREFRLRLSDVDKAVHEMEARGHHFIDDLFRLPRIADLMKSDKIKHDFERDVIASAPAEIEAKVESIIDWLVSSDLEQWRFVKDHIGRRRSRQSKEALGELASGFNYDRRRLMDSAGRAAQETLEGYDKHVEANRIAESLQGAVANTALLEVGAVGLGTIVTLAATSTAADITGLLAAGVLATLGFFVIPQKRRGAKKELREKISTMRNQLMTALTRQFEAEIGGSIQRLTEGIAPYSRFTRAQQQTQRQRRDELLAVQQALTAIRSEIEAGRSQTPLAAV